MLPHLTSDKGEAVPINPVTPDGFAAWLVAAAERDRNWLQATGFAAEPGKVAPLPGPDGRLARILVGVAPDETLWSIAALPDTLPEGEKRSTVLRVAASSSGITSSSNAAPVCLSASHGRSDQDE